VLPTGAQHLVLLRLTPDIYELNFCC